MQMEWQETLGTERSGHFYDWVMPDRWEILTPTDGSPDFERYPIELKYVLAIQPSRIKQAEDLLSRGCGFGVRCSRRVGQNPAQAAKRLAALHEGQLLPWLERLFASGQAPVFDDRTKEIAVERGWNVENDLAVLTDLAECHRHFALLHLPNAKPETSDVEFMTQLNRDLRQISAVSLATSVARATGPHFEPTLWTLAASVFVLAPLVHLLGWWSPGVAVVLAALGLSTGWSAWRAYDARILGAASRQLKHRVMRDLSGWLVALALGVLSAATMDGWPLLGAASFALAVTAPHWARLIRSFKRQYLLYGRLHVEGRLGGDQQGRWLVHGFRSSLGIWCWAGALSLILTMAVFFVWPGAWGNGWVLAGLAAAPWALYDLGLLAAAWLSDWQFRRGLGRLLKRTILLVT